jgi:hypothetical protein
MRASCHSEISFKVLNLQRNLFCRALATGRRNGEVAAAGRFCRVVYALLTIKGEVPGHGLFIIWC